MAASHQVWALIQVRCQANQKSAWRLNLPIKIRARGGTRFDEENTVPAGGRAAERPWNRIHSANEAAQRDLSVLIRVKKWRVKQSKSFLTDSSHYNKKREGRTNPSPIRKCNVNQWQIAYPPRRKGMKLCAAAALGETSLGQIIQAREVAGGPVARVDDGGLEIALVHGDYI